MILDRRDLDEIEDLLRELEEGNITKVAFLPREKAGRFEVENLKIEVKGSSGDIVLHCPEASDEGTPVCTVVVGGRTIATGVPVPRKLLYKVKNLIKVGLGGVPTREESGWIVVEPKKRDVEFTGKSES